MRKEFTQKERQEYLKGLHKKNLAACALFFNSKNRLLILNPNYGSCHLLPGGDMEPGESPVETAIREVREEIGLDLKIQKCLIVDTRVRDLKNGYREESLLFIFLGQRLTSRDIKKIKLQETEIVGKVFLPWGEALKKLCPRMRTRLRHLDLENFLAPTLFLKNGKREF